MPQTYTECPHCGERLYLAGFDLAPIEQEVYWCNDCGTIWTEQELDWEKAASEAFSKAEAAQKSQGE